MRAEEVVPDERMPDCREDREALRQCVDDYVAGRRLTPPLMLEELRQHADQICRAASLHEGMIDFVTVLVGNAIWRDTVAGIPYERRILLLPQCLRSRARCPAAVDAFGLVCEECGGCLIGRLQKEAEALGYVVLVAEGTTVVTKLLDQGKVDAVIGVSCLSSLERSFLHMAADAIPGIAIPLLRDGCDETAVDEAWIREAVLLKTEQPWFGRLDLDRLQGQVEGWFTREALDRLLCTTGSTTESIAAEWVAKAGKRRRPFLVAALYQALHPETGCMPDAIPRLGVAVECFHKASLIHDDIEDEDNFRYGDMTLHRQYGIPIALNAGDLLVGDGYRLIAGCDAPASRKERMLAVAAEGHRSLSLGQGEELLWMRKPEPPRPDEVLAVFRLKTAPAFEVALLLGAHYGGAPDTVCEVLRAFSRALGVAYQIRDDLNDGSAMAGSAERVRIEPSLLLALAWEAACGTDRDRLAALWRQRRMSPDERVELMRMVRGLRIEQRAGQLLEHYKNEAVRSLNPLDNAHVKSLLQRMVARMFKV
jgi:geranylgeranyl diphosphate synthase type II